MAKIKKNDVVLVCTGKDRGKTGKVIGVNVSKNTILVEGVNKFKKHAKPSNKYPQGGIIDVTRPISVSNVQIICLACKKPTRISYKNTGTEKRRICRKCGEVVDAS